MPGFRSRLAPRRPKLLLVLLVVVLAVSVGSIAFVTRDRPMHRWTAALANRDNAPAKLLAIGESSTEGQGASTRDKRWLNLLTAQLRAQYPVAGVVGGENYLPATYRVYEPESPWGTPYTSSGTVTPIYWGGNLGYRALEMQEQASATYTVVGDSVDIWYFTGPERGTLSYRVDDGEPVSVNTNESVYRANARVQDVSLGAAGSHEVTIEASSGTIDLGGFSIFNGDRNAGVQVYDASYSGATVATFLSEEAQFKASVASVAPDLVTIDLAGNDYFAKTEPKVFEGEMQRLISDLTSLKKKPSILLIAPYQPNDADAVAGAYDKLVEVMRDLAEDNSAHVTLLDLSQASAMGSVSTDTRGWYSSDGIHPNDAGYARFNELVYGAITVQP